MFMFYLFVMVAQVFRFSGTSDDCMGVWSHVIYLALASERLGGCFLANVYGDRCLSVLSNDKCAIFFYLKAKGFFIYLLLFQNKYVKHKWDSVWFIGDAS